MGTTVRLTYADLRHTPEDGKRYELIDGELIVSAAPNLPHQGVVGEIHLGLRAHVDPRHLGTVWLAPCDVRFSDQDVVEPDLLFVAAGREAILGEQAVEGAPDLVIEVLSPRTAERDMTVKLALYARYGVHEYWVVSPEARQIIVYDLTTPGVPATRYTVPDVLRSRVLPDLALPLATLFR